MEQINVRLMWQQGYKEVRASLVGGKEGVFAVWSEATEDGRRLIHMASGDDGSWWEIAHYHDRWVPKMIEALQENLEE